MMTVHGYKTKAALKASVGKYFHFEETSMFGAEHKAPGANTVVGPSAYDRKWYATVTVDADNIIQKVS
jgi:hypothetical protein